jgi:outer membrane protein OmpA-like peptidoglycan-associated protein
MACSIRWISVCSSQLAPAPIPVDPAARWPTRITTRFPTLLTLAQTRPARRIPTRSATAARAVVEIRGCQLVILKPIQFKPNSEVIDEKASGKVLLAVADALKASPNIKRLRIEGHTDTQCPVKFRKTCKTYNQDLSERRVISVRKWLIKNGIEEGRLEGKAHGHEKPIAPNNATWLGQEPPRRVPPARLQ